MKTKITIVLIFILYLTTCFSQELNISFSLNPKFKNETFSGRLFLFFNADTNARMRNPSFARPQPSFAVDISGWKQGEKFVVNSKNVVSWMGNMDSLKGPYVIYAALKTNFTERGFNNVGNLFSGKKVIKIERNTNINFELEFLDKVDKGKIFKETEFLKETIITLTGKNKNSVCTESIKTAVFLPKNYYTDTLKSYPVVYVLPAWGSVHYDIMESDFYHKRYGMGKYAIGEEKIFVYLNHDCGNGYHEFVNSENNGPMEKILFTDVIPFIEKKYRCNGNPSQRFLMGHSSGAWASLWLIINKPEFFGGAFVTAPDPVDFTSFISENIYDKTTNFFTDKSGSEKYLMKNLKTKDFIAFEKLMGPGEQMNSFNAVFSQKGKDGKPEKIFDWNTGAINTKVAKNWEKYDLGKIVSKLDAKKKKQLNGKIYITVAQDDEFALNRPVEILKEKLQKAGIGADIVFPEKGGHSNVWNQEVAKKYNQAIDSLSISKK